MRLASSTPHHLRIVPASRSTPPKRPIRLNHPTPIDNISSQPVAHLSRSRCVPTTILSAVKRSTPERCVLSFRQTTRSMNSLVPTEGLYRLHIRPKPSPMQILYTRMFVDRLVLKQGKLFVRGDSKIFRFQNGKSESLFLQRKNPRRIAWTVLFRRQHKKGISEVGTAFSFRR